MELNMMLEPGDGRHLYQQIYEYIREEIRAGRLLPGERLPATRRLAGTLRIARTTVELAYEQLEEEGYIVIRRGSGAYVCEISNMTDLSYDRQDLPGIGEKTETGLLQGRSVRMQLNTAVWMNTGSVTNDVFDESSAISEGAADPVDRSRKAAAAMTGQIDFSPRTIDMSVFPYATWRRILRGILTGDRADLFHRGDPQGDLELRTTIARYLHLSRGCLCEPEQIIIGAGNDYLLMLLAMILGEYHSIAMDPITYLRAADVMRGMGFAVRGVEGDEQGMSVTALRRSGCRLAYVMPARQFPTGIVMQYPRRAEFLSWASGEADGYIIEDDYDSEFKYRGRPVPSLQSADQNDRVIYMGTFSKAIAPAIRISYLILPKRLLETFHQKAGFLSCTVPRLDQAVLNEFIKDGYFERYLNRMRNRYKAKHDRLLELLAPLEKDFVITGQGAGLHLVLTLRREAALRMGVDEPYDKAEEELSRRAGEKGVCVYPMSEQRMSEGNVNVTGKMQPAILLGYAALTEEEMDEGIRLLQEAWK